MRGSPISWIQESVAGSDHECRAAIDLQSVPCTSLGLATVPEMVAQNGGSIAVSSQPGHGTTFKITFPRAEETAHSIYLSEQRSIARPGTETILLAEDDDQVRSYVRDALCNAGYTVLRKPFSIQELLSCVRAAIDGADRPPQALARIDSIIEAA